MNTIRTGDRVSFLSRVTGTRIHGEVIRHNERFYTVQLSSGITTVPARAITKECEQMTNFRPTRFKIWYIHEIPGKTFEHEVPDAQTGETVLEAIYALALFQFENSLIPDYANAGGIVYLDEDGEWSDYDPEKWPEVS